MFHTYYCLAQGKKVFELLSALLCMTKVVFLLSLYGWDFNDGGILDT